MRAQSQQLPWTKPSLSSYLGVVLCFLLTFVGRFLVGKGYYTVLYGTTMPPRPVNTHRYGVSRNSVIFCQPSFDAIPSVA